MNHVLLFLLCLLSTTQLFAQENEIPTSIERGAIVYKRNCAVCHSKKGTGKGKRIPPLAGSDYLMNNRIESIRAVKYGLEGKITVNGIVYDKEMKAVNLSEQEVADVMNYIRNTWGNQSDETVTATEVAAIQKD
ncbi:cytochrome c [Aggregatimonas sangjinii]|uniref:Cytochrome c n=1 Tax=Aggregatimonas sangjinii TaxID=2583587 RepID=A0A5B7SLX1_9FLAO|nr:cytochrome c [Aggregatimonas sangjinii]QCW99624.1 cytochrome c [Aggregatimonas sangjinii]